MRNRIIAFIVSRRCFTIVAILLLLGGLVLAAKGRVVIGGMLLYLAVLSFFLICWHGFCQQARPSEVTLTVVPPDNCGKAECSNCTKCTCHGSGESGGDVPRNGC